MSSSKSQLPVRHYKGTAVYDWDSEPVSERPSEFEASSLYSSQLSGNSSFNARRVHEPRRTQGLRTLWASLALVAVVAGCGLWGLVHWLR